MNDTQTDRKNYLQVPCENENNKKKTLQTIINVN